MKHLIEYKLIQEYYGDTRAKRSGVPYMNHIDEGLEILKRIDASIFSIKAYCLHPILQDDDALEDNINNIIKLALVDHRVLILAMEYRNVANRGLSCYQVDNPANIYLSPLKTVNDMLIADKVQNRKDFELYHKGTHEKSIELDRYFKNWLRALNVTERKYLELIEGL